MQPEEAKGAEADIALASYISLYVIIKCRPLCKATTDQNALEMHSEAPFVAHAVQGDVCKTNEQIDVVRDWCD